MPTTQPLDHIVRCVTATDPIGYEVTAPIGRDDADAHADRRNSLTVDPSDDRRYVVEQVDRIRCLRQTALVDAMGPPAVTNDEHRARPLYAAIPDGTDIDEGLQADVEAIIGRPLNAFYPKHPTFHPASVRAALRRWGRREAAGFATSTLQRPAAS